ncbi:MAG: hypothetical protein Q8N63_02745, partial [Nanoarchaeota archaeon]|nr:hypothetical protein [Nanoarchaeota archaeon]
GIGYSVGAGRYTFQGEGNEAHHIASTTEIYLGLNADCPLNPSVKFYHDVDEVEGTYAQFSVGHSQEKFANVCGVPLGIKAGASLGWGSNSYNKYYWGVEGGNLNDLTLSLAFPLEVCGWGVTPNINYATIVDGDVRSANAYGDNHNLFAGINFCKKF